VDHINEGINRLTGVRAATDLRDSLEVSDCWLFLMITMLTSFMQKETDDRIKDQIRDVFLRSVDRDLRPSSKAIQSVVGLAKKYRHELKNSRMSGATCRKQAKWIGVERYVYPHISTCSMFLILCQA
jgi:hypothetical protein